MVGSVDLQQSDYTDLLRAIKPDESLNRHFSKQATYGQYCIPRVLPYWRPVCSENDDDAHRFDYDHCPKRYP